MRQRILRLPADCGPQLAGLSDVHEIRMVLEGAARALLDEIKDLPSKVTGPEVARKPRGERRAPGGGGKPARTQTPAGQNTAVCRPTLGKLRAKVPVPGFAERARL